MGTEEHDEAMEEDEFYGYPNEQPAEDAEEEEPETPPKEEAEKEPEGPSLEALQKKERDLNKGFEEVARKRKELEEYEARLRAGGVEQEEEEEPEVGEDLTPEARKILKKFMTDEFGPVFNSVETMYADMVNSELTRFANEKGVDEQELVDTIRQYSLSPVDYSLGSAQKVYEQAYALYKSKNFDEKNLEDRIREKVLAELAEQGALVEGIKPKPNAEPEPEVESGVSPYDMEPEERMAYIRKRHPEWFGSE